jgi:hypothetical protein
MPGTCSGVVISNCQAQPIRHTLSLACHGMTFAAFGVHLIAPRNREATIAEFVVEAQKFDVIITICLSDDFGPLSQKQIAQTFPGKPIIFIPNFFFSGLHPDLTYLGDLGNRVSGPLSEYHSKLVVLGYVAGLSARQVEELFQYEVYRKVGFLDEFGRSIAEAHRRDAGLSVPFGSEMEGLLKQELCFLSVNHPTSFLLAHFCAKLARSLEETGMAQAAKGLVQPYTLVNFLAYNVVFPVYPEIAAALGLLFPGSYLFKPTTAGDAAVNCFSLHEYIRLELESLRNIPVSALLEGRHTQHFLRTSAAALGLQL